MAKYAFTATVQVDTEQKSVDVKMDAECLTRKGGTTTEYERELIGNFLLTLLLERSELSELDLIGDLLYEVKRVLHINEAEGRKRLQDANSEVLLHALAHEDFLMTEANEGFA